MRQESRNWSHRYGFLDNCICASDGTHIPFTPTDFPKVKLTLFCLKVEGFQITAIDFSYFPLIFTQTLPGPSSYSLAHTNTHTLTHSHTHTHAHTHTPTHTHTLTHTLTHTHTRTHSLTHSHTHTHAHTLTHTLTHSHTHSLSPSLTPLSHQYLRARAHLPHKGKNQPPFPTSSHFQTQTQTRTHSHTHSLTHTLTHSLPLSPPSPTNIYAHAHPHTPSIVSHSNTCSNLGGSETARGSLR